MNNQDKIQQLSQLITAGLASLLSGRDCILLDAPYHNNIGDICIWQGEVDFLKSVGAKLLFTKSLYWTPSNDLSPETIILLHGGGNFGDIYRSCQDFRLKIIERYPNNRIVMFPQSVWYDDPNLIAHDSAIMSRHKDLWLCARDRKAYQFMKEHFPVNNILLLPDMAFCILDSSLYHFRTLEKTGNKLFMRRMDGELVKDTIATLDSFDVKDWPGFDGSDIKYFFFHHAKRGIRVLSKLYLPIGQQWERLIDTIAAQSLRPRLVKTGLSFLAGYDSITTTRLHALILGVLLGKPIEYIDNKTGKLSDFANTWLSDLESVKKADI